MPQFNATLSDGRVVTLEGDKEPTEQEVMDAVSQHEEPVKTSAWGAVGRAAAESVLPSAGAAAGAAGALSAEINPLAHVAPPWSEIGFGLGGAVAGGWAAGKAQKTIAQAVIPEQYKQWEELRRSDVEQHPIAEAGGELLGALSTFEANPMGSAKGIYHAGRAMLGKTLTKPQVEQAMGAAIQTGFGVAQSALSGDTSLKGMAKEAIIMNLLGHSRWKGLRPSAGGPERVRPTAPPEVMASREQALLKSAEEQSGKKWSITNEEPPTNKGDVAHTDPKTGNVTVFRRNLHEWLDQDVPQGYGDEQAINNLVNHETIHGLTSDELGKEFEQSLTSFQRWNYRRRYHGPFHAGEKLSGVTLGKEALRYEVQLASEMEPSEYIAHAQEARATKFLTVLDKAANIFRSRARTDAQRAMVERLTSNIEAAKGATDASRVTSPEGSTQREVRPPVGEEAPLRQQGEAAPAQAPVAEEAQVPLTKPEQSRMNPVDAHEFQQSLRKKRVRALRLLRDDHESDPTSHSDHAVELINEVIAEKSKSGKIILGKEQAPPAAPTGEAPEPQVGPVKAETPVAPPPEAPAAKATISQSFTESNAKELHQLSREVTGENFDPFSKEGQEKYDRWVKLSDASAEADAKAGIGPKPQGETLAMTRKDLMDRAERVRGMTPQEFIDSYPRGFNRENFPLGEGASAEEVSKLKEYRSEIQSKLSTVLDKIRSRSATPEEMNDVASLGNKRQYYDEAIQAAPKEVGGDGRVFLGKEERAKEMLAMGRKQRSPDDQLAARIIKSIGGVPGDPKKLAKAKATYEKIKSLPIENREEALNAFHMEQKFDQMEEAVRLAQKQAEEDAKSAASDQGINIVDLPTPEEIKEKLGVADRQVLYRSAMATISRKATPLAPGGPQLMVKGTKQAGGKEVTRLATTSTEKSDIAAKPRYDVGDYQEFLSDIKDRYPHIQEWAAQEVFKDAVHDFLNNASGAKLTELLRPARMEGFLGKSTDPQAQRVIPDASPLPILGDIAKFKDPINSPKFKAWLEANDLRPEEAARGLEMLKAIRDAELNDRVEAIKGPPGPEPGKGFAREARTPAEEKEAGRIWKEGWSANQARRHRVIDALSQWYLKQAIPPERSPNRRTISIEDVWFDHHLKEHVPAYAEFTKQQGSDGVELKRVLGKGGGIEGKSGTLTRSIAIVVDPKTGEHHGVSVYKRGEDQPMVYDPSVYAGSKEGHHITVTELLANEYRVLGQLLVRDPVQNFHQKWTAENFEKEIGKESRHREGPIGMWMALQKQLRIEKAVEKARLHDERFLGGVKKEEVTGDKPAAEGETAAEAADREKEEEDKSKETSREEEAKPTLRQQIAKAREEAGGRPWEEAEEFEMGRGLNPFDRASLQMWMKGGSGSDVLGLYKSNEHDMASLLGSELSNVEVDAVYQMVDEFGVKDSVRMPDVIRGIEARRSKRGYYDSREVCALYGIDKMSKLEFDRLAAEPEELAKTSRMEPIPKDVGYLDMTEGQKDHYNYRDAQKVRAINRTLRRIYEIAEESRKQISAGVKAGAEGELPLPQDVVAFRTRALDRYGDVARRDVEQAALSEERAARARTEGPGVERELSYEQRQPAGRAPVIPLQAGVTAGRNLPRYPDQPAVLPEGTTPPPATTPQPVEPEPTIFKPHPAHPEEYRKFGKRPFTPSGNPKSDAEMWQLFIRNQIRRSGEPLPMTRKGYGPARVYQEEMAKSGRAIPRPGLEGPPQSKEQLIAKGRELVASGKINPVKEMRQFEMAEKNDPESGYLSTNSTLAFRYWGLRLQSWADDVIAKTRDTKSPEAQAAIKRSSDWQRRIEGSSYQIFARTGHGLQGWNQVGPNDMKSTTFVRRFVRKAKAAARGVREEDVDLTDEEEGVISSITARVKEAEDVRSMTETQVGEAWVKPSSPPLDKGQADVVEKAKTIADKVDQDAAAKAKKGKPNNPPAMAMKGEGEGEALPPMDNEQETIFGNLGMRVMQKLSEANQFNDANWMEAMGKRLRDPDVDRPDMEPYLPHIRALANEFNEIFINNYVGTGDPVKDAREIFKRKKPPIEESIRAIRRALEVDPSGRKISPAEAYHIWNYLNERFLHNPDENKRTLDFRTIRTEASAELGIKDDSGKIIPGKEYSQLRLFRAMAANRTMRKATEELITSMRNESRVKSQAMNWLKNQEFPGWLRMARLFPRVFFFDKILGHSFVPMITHAPTMAFNPMAWSEYFGRPRWVAAMTGKPYVEGAWQKMYKMGGIPTAKSQAEAEIYHRSQMESMTSHERFEAWKKADLQCDPFRHTDDYQIEALQKVFGERLSWLTSGRGFDALKTLRYSMAEKWLNSLPEHLRNEESMNLIARSVNHATGIVKARPPEALNWIAFAPKLEFSRWAYLFADTVKALNYIANWKIASLEQRAWARSEMMQKASVLGMYIGMLGLNQAFLAMTGSDQKINGIPKSLGGGGADPTKTDFLAFKVAGFRVGVATPFIGMIKMFSRALHTAFMERTKFEKLTPRSKALMGVGTDYARGKASPLASFTLDIASGQDYARRPIPVPWAEPLSRSQLMQGKKPYGVGEFLGEEFAPIPIEEGVKEMFKSQGMSDSEAKRWIRTLIISVGMGGTGARIAEDDKH